MSKFTTAVKNVVVLVLENRSFDHMCGWFGTPKGLSGAESNLLDPADPASTEIKVSRDASYSGDLSVDPSHAFADVTVQIYGVAQAPAAPPVVHSSGFVLDYGRQAGSVPANIMKCFDPSRLPVLHTLATEYALCEQWYSSVPAQTWPNRFFLHCATSGGFLDNELRDYGMPTIYENLTGAGYSWAVYFHDIAQSLALARLQDSTFRGNFKFMPEFFRDLQNKTLPAYSFIEPRYFDFLRWKANDQHPPHDVSLGEHLIADVYEALRGSPYWNQSLFVVLSDEHGGIYDHLLPPAAVSPDEPSASNPVFNFTRLGVRVPAVLVSPLIPRQTLISDIQFDHTSLLATLRDVFDLPRSLTARDARAKTFTAWLQHDARSDADCPRTLPRPPQAQADEFHQSSVAATMTATKVSEDLTTTLRSRSAPSEFQTSLVKFARRLDVPESPQLRVLRHARAIDDEHDAAVHVRETVTRFVQGAR
jgi:phospholipase C